MYYETHSHTELCRHAVGTPEEYARLAYLKGLAGVFVTCHNPLPEGIGQRIRMYEDELPRYLALVHQTADRLAPEGIDVRLGLEADYLPGLEPYLHKQLTSAPFDYVLGSVHWHMPEWQDIFWDGCRHSLVRSYFEQLAEAAESELFDCLAHPDIIKNCDPASWRVEDYREDIEAALDRIAETGVAMELNTSGCLKSFPEFNPGREILAMMFRRSIPVVVGADAHSPDRVGDRFISAFQLLLEVGYTEVQLFFSRKAQSVPIREALAGLQGKSPVLVGPRLAL